GIYLSLAAPLRTLLALVLGVLRWRFTRPHRHGSRGPCRRFARWHHVGGLLFGLLPLAWIFSRLMSMTPWRIFTSSAPLDTSGYAGGELHAAHFPLAPDAALQQLQAGGLPARDLHKMLDGCRGHHLGRDAEGS